MKFFVVSKADPSMPPTCIDTSNAAALILLDNAGQYSYQTDTLSADHMASVVASLKGEQPTAPEKRRRGG